MSALHELNVGDLRAAMHQVIPDVPGLATTSPIDLSTPILDRNTIIRDTLVDIINADTVKIEPSSDDLETKVTLAKLESYTILASCGLELEPYIIEGDADDAHFKPEAEELARLDAWVLESTLRPIFHSGYRQLEQDKTWIHNIQPRFKKIFREYKSLTNEPVSGVELQNLLNGGATGGIVEELVRLAIKLEQQPGHGADPAEDMKQRLKNRLTTVRHLAYLGTSSAALNFGSFTNAEPLSSLEGEMQTITKNGVTNTHFRHATREGMRKAFPASRENWLDVSMRGPTLKCPFHQLASQEAPNKNTLVSNAVDAAITFVGAQPRKFLMTDSEIAFLSYQQVADLTKD